ncbi:MAG: hypothetical protein U9O98_01235 [Asgard group archaeon]|nr:hypothetical protein [Asgard group archaeon]
MSTLNIQWKLGKPFGVLAILTSFAMLSQIPIIYHALEILEAIQLKYVAAYIAVTIATIIVITNLETVLYEGLLVRLRSYDIRDYRAPFLTVSIAHVIYYIFYFLTYTTLNKVELFTLQLPIAQYAFCQMIGLLILTILVIWFYKRQTRNKAALP